MRGESINTEHHGTSQRRKPSRGTCRAWPGKKLCLRGTPALETTDEPEREVEDNREGLSSSPRCAWLAPARLAAPLAQVVRENDAHVRL